MGSFGAFVSILARNSKMADQTAKQIKIWALGSMWNVQGTIWPQTSAKNMDHSDSALSYPLPRNPSPRTSHLTLLIHPVYQPLHSLKLYPTLTYLKIIPITSLQTHPRNLHYFKNSQPESFLPLPPTHHTIMLCPSQFYSFRYSPYPIPHVILPIPSCPMIWRRWDYYILYAVVLRILLI